MTASRGSYVAPAGRFTIPVPHNWQLTQTIDALELLSPKGTSAIRITAYIQKNNKANTDARFHIQRFLAVQSIRGKAKNLTNRRSCAEAEFVDIEGRNWHVRLLSSDRVLLLATCTTALRSADAIVGKTLLDDLRIGAPLPSVRGMSKNTFRRQST